jgi:hypothetical protein
MANRLVSLTDGALLVAVVLMVVFGLFALLFH